MIKVPATVKQSSIHGMGLFALTRIPKGTLVWKFQEPDRIIPKEIASEEAMHFGYVNPRNSDSVVECGDHAKFINFSTKEEATLIERVALGESDLVASRDIMEGEELTVDPSTDADFSRKMAV